MSIQKEVFRTIKNSKSIQIFRSIQSKIPERSFHLHNHVLYDFRTMLGEEHKVYLEIGAYCGASASLLLSHPYKTTVISIDPCFFASQPLQWNP